MSIINQYPRSVDNDEDRFTLDGLTDLELSLLSIELLEQDDYTPPPAANGPVEK